MKKVVKEKTNKLEDVIEAIMCPYKSVMVLYDGCSPRILTEYGAFDLSGRRCYSDYDEDLKKTVERYICFYKDIYIIDIEKVTDFIKDCDGYLPILIENSISIDELIKNFEKYIVVIKINDCSDSYIRIVVKDGCIYKTYDLQGTMQICSERFNYIFKQYTCSPFNSDIYTFESEEELIDWLRNNV